MIFQPSRWSVRLTEFVEVLDVKLNQVAVLEAGRVKVSSLTLEVYLN
jgi:hypothetical protein